MAPTFLEFAGPWALAEALAASVAGDLRAAIDARARATLVLSGGTTPRRFLDALSRQALAWDAVDVTLADERWVAPDHERSNERLVRDTLLRGDAAAARFVPLYREDFASPDAALETIAQDLATLSVPFDVVVLGMGEDGHCASLFPDGDLTPSALRADASERVLAIRAPSAGETRITLTLPALAATRAMYLHIEGAAKREVLARALAAPAPVAPIAHVLAAAAATPEIFYCP
jgi:6-phosphogluconolactonase